jgi:ABC-type transport system substrate-binding protein
VVRIVPEVGTRRQLLESGKADATALNLTPEIVDAVKSNPALQVITYPSSAVFWTIMNAATLNVTARQGFSYAFPYDQVKDSAYKGLIRRSGPLATTVRGADPDVFIYPVDLDRAKELLVEAGFPAGSSFSYAFSSGEEIEQVIAQLFQANLQNIGYTLTLEPIERGALVDLVYGDSEAESRPDFIGGWGWWPDYNDPWNQFSPNFSDKEKYGISNGGYWLNPRFEEIMTEAESYTDEALLIELMHEAQNILTEQDPPAIYYGELLWYTVLRSDVKGFIPNPLYLNAFPFYRMYREG